MTPRPLSIVSDGCAYVDVDVACAQRVVPLEVLEYDRKKGGLPGLLAKFKVPLTGCRITKRGLFGTPASDDPHSREPKSYWIPAPIYVARIGPLPPVDTLPSNNDGSPPQSTSRSDGAGPKTSCSDGAGASNTPNGPPDDAAAEGTAPNDEPPLLRRIQLDTDERFVFCGQKLDIAAYGERSPDEFYLGVDDIRRTLNILPNNALPASIVVTKICIQDDGVARTIDALSWGEFMATIAAYRHKTDVAAHLFHWACSVLYAAAHGAPDVRETMRDAVNAQFTSRPLGIGWQDDVAEHRGRPVNYLIEVCSFESFAIAHPEAARVFQASLPAGADLKQYVVVKYGAGVDGARRMRQVYRELVKIVPGCTPYTVDTAHFPGASQEIVEGHERDWKAAFEEFNLKGVPGPRGAYTELFVLNHEMLELARRRMARLVVKHAADDRVELEEQVRAARVECAEERERARETHAKSAILECRLENAESLRETAEKLRVSRREQMRTDHEREYSSQGGADERTTEKDGVAVRQGVSDWRALLGARTM